MANIFDESHYARDWEQYWEADILMLLEDLLGAVRTNGSDNTSLLSINFARAGLLIQTSVRIYCKKVDAVYDICHQLCGGLLTSDKTAHNVNSERPKEKRVHSIDGFVSLDNLQTCKDLFLPEENSYLVKRRHYLPLVPASLIPLECQDKIDIILYDIKGGKLGNKSDIRMNSCSLDVSGALLLSMYWEHDISHYLLSPIRVKNSGVTSDVSSSPDEGYGSFSLSCDAGNSLRCDDQVSVISSLSGSANQDISVAQLATEDITENVEIVETSPKRPKRTVRKDNVQEDEAEIKEQKSSNKTKTKKSKSAKKSCENHSDDKNSICSSGDETSNHVCSLDIAENETDGNCCVVGQCLNSENPKASEQPEEIAESCPEPSLQPPLLSSYVATDIENSPALNHNDVHNCHSGNEDVFPPAVPIESTECESTYASAERNLENYLSQILPYKKTNDWMHKVVEWHENIKDILEAEEKREKFDIHRYAGKVMDRFSTNNRKQTLSLSSVCKGKAKWEICRYFLATLQLANNCNIDISSSKTSEGTDDIELSLLSRNAPHGFSTCER